MRPRLEAWLARKLSPSSGVAVGDVRGPSETGMSSDTILFDASWTEDGKARTEQLVARIAPDPSDVPVFPSYHLARQARLISLVGDLTCVPVPKVWWSEEDPAVIGAPFFVMERVEGEVPPDVLPYTFGGNWLYDADRADQRRLQDATVGAIAQLHSVDDPETRFSFMTFSDHGDTPLRRHIAHTRAWYEYVSGDGARSPLTEAAFEWLDSHWPPTEPEAVLAWGDARIGNVLYRDFSPVAILDWEMAGLGPRELDVAWLLFAHEVFEHLAGRFGAPGMPHFLRADDVVERYEQLTGYRLADLAFYRTYAALQWAIVFVRTGCRAVHFGEREMPSDIDDLLHHRELFAGML